MYIVCVFPVPVRASARRLPLFSSYFLPMGMSLGMHLSNCLRPSHAVCPTTLIYMCTITHLEMWLSTLPDTVGARSCLPMRVPDDVILTCLKASMPIKPRGIWPKGCSSRHQLGLQFSAWLNRASVLFHIFAVCGDMDGMVQTRTLLCTAR